MWPNFVKHYLKNIQGNEYWYLQDSIKIGGRAKIIVAYVAPKDTPHDKLKEAIKVAVQKLTNRAYEVVFNERKKKFKFEHLTALQVEELETLRFDYNYRLKRLYPSAFKMYKDAGYIRYVHGTTAIEGNTYTLEQTKQVMEDEISIAGKSLREQHEIENYKKLREFIENYNKKFDSKFIKKVHEIICASIPNCDPGNWRRIPIEIKGTNVDVVPAEAIPWEMESLISWFNKKVEKNYHILEVACQFHQRFEEIHPFRDGNGRVGRELVNYFLERMDYPPVYLEKVDREPYLAALKQGNKDKFRPLMDLVFTKLIRNHEKFLEKIKNTNVEAVEGISEKGVQTNLWEYIMDT